MTSLIWVNCMNRLYVHMCACVCVCVCVCECTRVHTVCAIFVIKSIYFNSTS